MLGFRDTPLGAYLADLYHRWAKRQINPHLYIVEDQDASKVGIAIGEKGMLGRFRTYGSCSAYFRVRHCWPIERRIARLTEKNMRTYGDAMPGVRRLEGRKDWRTGVDTDAQAYYFPTACAEALAKLAADTSSGRVLDPFCGSGTTLAALTMSDPPYCRTC